MPIYEQQINMYNTMYHSPSPVRRLSIEKTIKTDLKDFEVMVEKGKWLIVKGTSMK